MSVLIHRRATIGRNVMIGAHAVIGGRSGQEPPTIDDGVYIGANACILGGIHIGTNATIGAGAVVLIDVPPDGTVVGNPGRILTAADAAPKR